MGFKLYSLYNLIIYRLIFIFNNLLDREILIYFIYFSFFVVFEKKVYFVIYKKFYFLCKYFF